MPIKKVNTATLVRGQILSLRLPLKMQTTDADKEPMRFEFGVPVVVVSAKVLAYLEEMYDEIEDGEGEIYEKPTFSVQRNVSEPEPEDNRRSRTQRLKADRPVKRRVKRRK